MINKYTLITIAFLIFGNCFANTEFDWRYSYTVSKKNNTDLSVDHEVYCHKGCPRKNIVVPEKGLTLKYDKVEWECRVQPSADMLISKKSKFHKIPVYSESRWIYCSHKKSSTEISEHLTCKREVNSGKNLHDTSLGNHFSTISFKQTFGADEYSIDLSIYCR